MQSFCQGTDTIIYIYIQQKLYVCSSALTSKLVNNFLATSYDKSYKQRIVH